MMRGEEVLDNMKENFDNERKISLKEFLQIEWRERRKRVILYILMYVPFIAIAIYEICNG